MNTLLHFLLLFQFQEHILGWPYLRQIKSDYHGWLSMMTSPEGPLFNLASCPPALNPPLLTGMGAIRWGTRGKCQ